MRSKTIRAAAHLAAFSSTTAAPDPSRTISQSAKPSGHVYAAADLITAFRYYRLGLCLFVKVPRNQARWLKGVRVAKANIARYPRRIQGSRRRLREVLSLPSINVRRAKARHAGRLKEYSPGTGSSRRLQSRRRCRPSGRTTFSRVSGARQAATSFHYLGFRAWGKKNRRLLERQPSSCPSDLSHVECIERRDE